MRKYISTMQLKGYQPYHFDDIMYHKDLTEFRFRSCGVHLNWNKEYLHEIYDYSINKLGHVAIRNGEDKDINYREIIEYLIRWLEDEHMGLYDAARETLKEKFDYE